MNAEQPIPGTEPYGARPPIQIPAPDKMRAEQSIGVVLEQIRSGQFSIDAGTALSDLVVLCRQQDAKGKLTIEVQVKPEDGADYVFLAASYKVSAPKVESPAVFYPDEYGVLARQPNQQNFGV